MILYFVHAPALGAALDEWEKDYVRGKLLKDGSQSPSEVVVSGYVDG